MNVRKLLIALLIASSIQVAQGSNQPARALEGIAVVDQAYGVPMDWFFSLQYHSPLGQSFTPMLPGLDVVEVSTTDFDLNNENGVELYINIRESNIYGSIIGTSNVIQLPNNFSGLTQFTFPTLVALRPGKVYVMEGIAVGGADMDNWAIAVGGSPASYPGGASILNGVEETNLDFFFREGLASSIPQSTAYCMRGLWAYLAREDGSGFKNQAECLRYLKTG
jgi:hypothetical protein